MNRFRRTLRLESASDRSPSRLAFRRALHTHKQNVFRAVRVIAPDLLALSFAGIAHAQGTMDFSGAQTLMSTFKTTEPKAAEWVLNAIGKVEIERVRRTLYDGNRNGHNFTIERQVEPLVLDSEISGLPDRHAFLKLGNYVANFSFAFQDIPSTQPAFLPRPLEDDDLTFDPKTLAKRGHRTAEAAATAGSDEADAEDVIEQSYSMGE